MAVRRTFAAALLAPALLALAACSSDDTSVADPPISSAPSSSAPPSQQRESPEHFIRRWAAEEKRMENTGDVSAYLSMSRDCEACTRLARQVQGFYAAGGFVRWGGWKIVRISVNSRHAKSTTYAVRNRSLPTRYRESSSGPIKRLSGGATTEILTLSPTPTSWILTSKAELAS